MKSTTTSTPRRSSSRQQETSEDTLEQIRLRAYELFEQRGGEEGHDLDDWLQAEAAVTRRSARRAAA